MSILTRIALIIGLGLCALLGLFFLTLSAASPRMPSFEQLVDYRPKLPLRVMSADGVLLGEFGEERRTVVRLNEVPKDLVNAILAAEDDRFYEHSGIDLFGIARSAVTNLISARKAQGASTITMQVARNFYLSSDKTFTRKIYEVLLALEIERQLSKDQILELYLNQIYLGRRAYGFSAAARTYFNKPIQRLSLAESAMLAGLPKAPSAYNPVSNPTRAKIRQEYILGRMRKLDMVSQDRYDAALKDSIVVATQSAGPTGEAMYAAELARIEIQDQFPDDLYTRGLTIFTTIRAADQSAATKALQAGLMSFDKRRGWRGPEENLALPAGGIESKPVREAVEAGLVDRNETAGMIPVVALEVSTDRLVLAMRSGRRIDLTGAELALGKPGLSATALPTRKIRRGSVLRVMKTARNYELVQLPTVEGALVSLDSDTGAIRALVGGFDFQRNKFNHVTQAYRQPGSSVKPFIYAAALEKGFSVSTQVEDAPVRFDPIKTGGELWEPKNYDAKYEGYMPLSDALAKSKNMVSIRLVDAIGPAYAQSFLTRFGFEPARNPPFLTLALGAGGVTPLQLASAYAVFSNGGYKVKPYLIDRVIDENGKLIMQTTPQRAGDDAPRVVDAATIYQAHELMRGVVLRGTARAALSLGRPDLAGKTGTTNDSQDAWFAGYSSGLAAAVWVGYDQPESLGDRETGGGLALPIWIDYMGKGLKSLSPRSPSPPPEILMVGGRPYTQSNAPGTGIGQLGSGGLGDLFR